MIKFEANPLWRYSLSTQMLIHGLGMCHSRLAHTLGVPIPNISQAPPKDPPPPPPSPRRL